MGEVVKFTTLAEMDAANDEECLIGDIICQECGHEWSGVAPVGAVDGLRCPMCKTHKGIFAHSVLPEVSWECTCGCNIFTVSGISRNILCWRCGTAQEFGNG